MRRWIHSLSWGKSLLSYVSYPHFLPPVDPPVRAHAVSLPRCSDWVYQPPRSPQQSSMQPLLNLHHPHPTLTSTSLRPASGDSFDSDSNGSNGFNSASSGSSSRPGTSPTGITSSRLGGVADWSASVVSLARLFDDTTFLQVTLTATPRDCVL